MNKATRDIMTLLSVDAGTAFAVQAGMNVDFSECTQREFVRAAREAYDTLLAVRQDMGCVA
jgi:hypothetical protein